MGLTLAFSIVGSFVEQIYFEAPLEVKINELKFNDYTEVQKKVFPSALAGENLVIETEYGEGKTASFVIPVLNQIYKTKSTGISTLILTPTRGLIFKVKKTIELYAESVGVNVFAFTRDRFLDNLESDLLGKHVVIATPDQLPHLDKYLNYSAITQLVIDDYDMMVFFKQNHAVLALLSKTIQPQVIIYTNQFKPTYLDDFKAVAALKQISVEPHDVPIVNMTHSKYVCEDADEQVHQIKSILSEERNRRVLVFVNEPWQMKKVADLIRHSLEMSCRYIDLERGEISAKDVQAFLEGSYHVLILYKYQNQDLHIHEASQIINIGIPFSSNDYASRLNHLARRPAFPARYSRPAF